MEQHLGKAAQMVSEVPGYTQDGPRAQSSRVQGTVEILTLLSAEAQSEFLPSFCPLCALPITIYVASEAAICTRGRGRWASAAGPRAFAKTHVLSLLFWDCPGPNSSLGDQQQAAESICLVQRGGGPLVYLSMGWNDRAKLLERAHL